MRAKLTCSPAQIVVLLISIDAELTPSSVRARLIEHDRLPFSNRAIDFVRLTKFYCEFDYVRLPNRSIRYAENHRVVDSLRRLGTDPIEKLELLSATHTYSRAILTHLRSCLTTSLLHP